MATLCDFSIDQRHFMNDSQNAQYRTRLSLGKSSLQTGNYNVAIDHFNNIVASLENKLAIALVHRSQAREKLESLQPSIEDAKEAVRLAPRLSVGYLQLAHLLWQEGETRETLLMYQKAMKNVTSDDKLYHQLESSKGYVEEQLNKQIGIFLPKLPYDIVDQILSHLPFAVLLKCRLICKQWNKTISKWPKLWKSIDTDWLLSSRVPLLVGKPLQRVTIEFAEDMEENAGVWKIPCCRHPGIMQVYYMQLQSISSTVSNLAIVVQLFLV